MNKTMEEKYAEVFARMREQMLAFLSKFRKE